MTKCLPKSGNADSEFYYSSIRETGGVYDVDHGIKLFESFFEHYSKLESTIMVD